MFINDIVLSINAEIKKQKDIHLHCLLTKLLFILENNHRDSTLVKIRKAIKFLSCIPIRMPRTLHHFFQHPTDIFCDPTICEIKGKAIRGDLVLTNIYITHAEATFFLNLYDKLMFAEFEYEFMKKDPVILRWQDEMIPLHAEYNKAFGDFTRGTTINLPSEVMPAAIDDFFRMVDHLKTNPDDSENIKGELRDLFPHMIAAYVSCSKHQAINDREEQLASSQEAKNLQIAYLMANGGQHMGSVVDHEFLKYGIVRGKTTTDYQEWCIDADKNCVFRTKMQICSFKSETGFLVDDDVVLDLDPIHKVKMSPHITMIPDAIAGELFNKMTPIAEIYLEVKLLVKDGVVCPEVTRFHMLGLANMQWLTDRLPEFKITQQGINDVVAEYKPTISNLVSLSTLDKAAYILQDYLKPSVGLIARLKNETPPDSCVRLAVVLIYLIREKGLDEEEVYEQVYGLNAYKLLSLKQLFDYGIRGTHLRKITDFYTDVEHERLTDLVVNLNKSPLLAVRDMNYRANPNRPAA